MWDIGSSWSHIGDEWVHDVTGEIRVPIHRKEVEPKTAGRPLFRKSATVAGNLSLPLSSLRGKSVSHPVSPRRDGEDSDSSNVHDFLDSSDSTCATSSTSRHRAFDCSQNFSRCLIFFCLFVWCGEIPQTNVHVFLSWRVDVHLVFLFLSFFFIFYFYFLTRFSVYFFCATKTNPPLLSQLVEIGDGLHSSRRMLVLTFNWKVWLRSTKEVLCSIYPMVMNLILLSNPRGEKNIYETEKKIFGDMNLISRDEFYSLAST